MTEFRKELQNIINKHNKETESNTPDFILAKYLENSLKNFDDTMKLRDEWQQSNLDSVNNRESNAFLKKDSWVY